MTSIKDRFQAVKDQINDISKKAKNFDVELLAVSKVHSTDKIREVFAAGHDYFGENYSQELVEKAKSLDELPIRWSYIGHIQSNKIKKIVQYAAEIQTLTNLKHAKLIEKAAVAYGKTPYPVYISCNPEQETGKSGLPIKDILPFVSAVEAECPNLMVKGLMCIPPKTYQDSLQDVPELYKSLRNLANQVGEGRLSLGMSGDLNIAILAGSNMVRIGTAIFGSRPQKARQ